MRTCHRRGNTVQVLRLPYGRITAGLGLCRGIEVMMEVIDRDLHRPESVYQHASPGVMPGRLCRSHVIVLNNNDVAECVPMR